MLRQWLAYIKYYNQPRSKDLAELALASAHAYFAEPRPRPSGYTQRAIEFQAYQRGFMNAYRHAYAKTQLESHN